MARSDIGPVRKTILRGLALLPVLCVVLYLVVVFLSSWLRPSEYR
jgi:hypothetical protein